MRSAVRSRRSRSAAPTASPWASTGPRSRRASWRRWSPSGPGPGSPWRSRCGGRLSMLAATLNSLALRLDPSLILGDLGIEPDGWQRRGLRSTYERMLICVHRQGGKSTAVAGLAIGTALHRDDSLVLLVSASLRQSQELFKKVVWSYRRLGSPIPTVEDNAVTLALANGSRVVSL